MKKYLVAGLIALFAVKGSPAGTTPTSPVFPYQDEDLDASWSADAARITLNGSSARVSGSGASVSGSTVTISRAGDYILSGTLSNGQIIVAAGKNDLVRLVLNGVRLSFSTGSPLYLKQARKTVLILPENTVNEVSDGASYRFSPGEDEPDAAIFAHDDLSITGKGALTVRGGYRNGIASKDTLVIGGGNITVTAVNDAFRGRDALAVRDGTLDADADGDGLKANNDQDPAKGYVILEGGTYTIRARTDGIQAETSLTITGGVFDVTTGNGADTSRNRAPQGRDPWGRQPLAAADQESKKAFKAGTTLLVSGGTFSVNAEDDAFHSNGDLTLSGGSFSVRTGDDGFHADALLRVDNGDITVTTCYEGLEGAQVEINGGNLRLTAMDDGINAAGGSNGGARGRPQDRFTSGGTYYVRIRGGTLDVLAYGDGIDANGYVYLEGGDTRISGPSMGMEGAVEFDIRFIITGGRLITAGSALSPARESTQPSLLFSYSSPVAEGGLISLRDDAGRVLLSYTARTDCTASAFTTPELQQGKIYTLLVNGQKRADLRLNGTVTALDEGGGAYRNGGRWGRR
ncbi:MAG: carbohydrate-binding domain-containing protein [Treponema sp.]|jgi:hypothetical protein|nr:carbohydrate-binding domain-containing protein [Treponema sp.]